jgi:hypothetical protein
MRLLVGVLNSGTVINLSDPDYLEWDTTHRNHPLRDPELDLAAVQWMSQGFLLNYNGRSHWGKTGNFPFYASPNNIPNSTALYPQLQAFLAYQQSIDPAGTFRNDFYKSALLNDPSFTHNKTYNRCALVYDCVCSSDNHCAAHQKCISQPLPNGKAARLCVDEEWTFKWGDMARHAKHWFGYLIARGVDFGKG